MDICLFDWGCVIGVMTSIWIGRISVLCVATIAGVSSGATAATYIEAMYGACVGDIAGA